MSRTALAIASATALATGLAVAPSASAADVVVTAPSKIVWHPTDPTIAYASITIPDLTNGTTYSIKMRAVNGVGAGTASSAVSVTPRTVPGAPTAVTATATNAQASVTWTAPTDNGGSAVTGYTVTASPGGATCSTAATSCDVTGLANGTAYTFTVTATNAAGVGTASVPSTAVTPRTVPDAPTSVTATAASRSARSPPARPKGGGCWTFHVTQTSSMGNFTCVTTEALAANVPDHLLNGGSYPVAHSIRAGRGAAGCTPRDPCGGATGHEAGRIRG